MVCSINRKHETDKKKRFSRSHLPGLDNLPDERGETSLRSIVLDRSLSPSPDSDSGGYWAPNLRPNSGGITSRDSSILNWY